MVLTWLEARAVGAELLLRIDDLDSTRTRKEFICGIFEVLAAAGMDWDLGPRSPEEFETSFSQSLLQPEYASAFEEALAAAPELFFVCDCSRRVLAGKREYPGSCREKGLEFRSNGTTAWRVRSDLLPAGDDGIVDPVIYRKERLYSYQWVSLQEDLRWGVTDIVRGSDLRSSSGFQSALAEALSLRGIEMYSRFASVRFLHHPLILDGGRKVSKSEGAASARGLIDNPQAWIPGFQRWLGFSADPAVRELASLRDWYREKRTDGNAPEFVGDLAIEALIY